MKFRSASLFRCCLPAWIGWGGLLAGTQAAPAGEPIQFSSPTKEVQTPASKSDFHNLPRPTLRWDLKSPGADIPPPIVIPRLDPRMERKLREQREEHKTWPFNEPTLFKDKLADPIQSSKTAMDEAFGGWDDTVARVLGKPERSTTKDPKANPLTTPLFSSGSLFDQDGKGGPLSSPASQATKAADEKELFPRNSDTAMKAFFQTKPGAEKVPMLPGMSLYELMGASKPTDSTIKREREARRQEFNRILSPQDPAAAAVAGLPGGALDQTRALMNPVAPATVEDALRPKTPFESIMPLANPGDKLAHPKLPFEEVLNRYQPVTAPKPAETKAGQMEALKLNTRPSVLSFPGRQF
jgi:hypothetical protein